MFSLAYVLLPFSGTPPARAIADSLARFERGGKGDVPEDWLRFHDETAAVRELHQTRFTFTKAEGLRIEGGEAWGLDARAVIAEMGRRGLSRWAVSFADIEPDLEAFARRFVTPFDRHPVTGGFGRWLNPLGRWDWWDLGGRFDGRIVGSRHQPGRPTSAIMSGPSEGRAVLTAIEDALHEALEQAPPAGIDIHANNNIELVRRLAEDLEAWQNHAIPGALVLPPGATEDRLRWLHNWPSIGPGDALAALDLPESTDWRRVVEEVYGRFGDHWAAGVSYHH